MRARIFAFLILVLLVIVPAYLYYDLTSRTIASIEISTGYDIPYSLHLVGSWGIDGLPLADRTLVYYQDCIGSCVISPILPARYTLTLTSTGYVDMIDTISVDIGEHLTRSYSLTRDITLSPVGAISSLSDVSSGSTWHIRSDTRSYTIEGQKETDDIRFTDAIDLTPEIRLGYIDQKDTAKLSLGNFPLGQSVLIRLDRTTGESIVVRQGLDIQAFILYRGQSAYIDGAGAIYTIHY